MSITLDYLVVSMLKCEQSKGQSIYQHGVSVNDHFQELIHDLQFEIQNENWKIPNWMIEYKNELLSNLHNNDSIIKYTIFHDCGKSFCLMIDSEGNRHFPDHANVSKQKFLEADADLIVANLIGWDMCIHQDSSLEIQKKLENEWSIKDACTLLLVSLAEIHSNAKIFGGMNTIKENLESTSFKIKWKQIEKRGKQICKFYFNK